jgi:hypothetical protein
MSTEKYKYDFMRYNSLHVLRPHALLIVILAYYLKDLLIAIVIAATAIKARGLSPEMRSLLDVSSPKMILSGMPIMFLIYALLNREPSASDRIRWIWRNGRHFILAAALLNSLLILSETTPLETLAGKALLGFLFFNITILFYIYRSEQVSDVFASFPDPPNQEKDSDNISK